MKNEDILRKIQGGNNTSEAYDELLKKYYKMIRKIISGFSLENGAFMVDEEELYQEGCLALYNAARNFDMERGVEFSTYAHKVIRNNIITRLREIKHRTSQDLYSIDNYGNSDYSNTFAVADNAVAYNHHEQFKEDIGTFLASLSEEDRKYLKMRRDGYTYKEIARICDVDEKRVDNRLASIKRRLKVFLEKK